MKKLIFILFAFMTLSFTANADAPLSCPVYNTDGVSAMVTKKGARADNYGGVYVPVRVTANESISLTRDIRVCVVVWEQDNPCNLTREFLDVSILSQKTSGTGSVYVNGLKKGVDYLFGIDEDQTCGE